MGKHRDVNGLIKFFRDILLGRKLSSGLRFSDELSARDYPSPVYPPSAHEKLSNNYYYNRNARVEVAQPIELKKGSLQIQDSLPTGNNDEAITECKIKYEKIQKNIGAEQPPTPGKVCFWDDHQFHCCK